MQLIFPPFYDIELFPIPSVFAYEIAFWHFKDWDKDKLVAAVSQISAGNYGNEVCSSYFACDKVAFVGNSYCLILFFFMIWIFNDTSSLNVIILESAKNIYLKKNETYYLKFKFKKQISSRKNTLSKSSKDYSFVRNGNPIKKLAEIHR